MNNIGIIIVNYCTPALVVANIESLAEENGRLGGALKVYVVDNCSKDGSTALIFGEIERRGWGDWVRLIPQQSNLGFAGGNNVALAEILERPNYCPYIMFLNPDATITPGSIESSRQFLLQRAEVGVVGSQLANPDGTQRRSAFRYPSPIGEFLRGARTGVLTRLFRRWEIAPPPEDTPQRTDWVSGAAFMVRRRVVEQVGLLDDRFFLYYEEVDFMRRINNANWEVWHNPKSVVVHLAGQATKIRGEVSEAGALPEYWYESWQRYYMKNHGRGKTCLAGLCWILGESIFRLRLWLRGDLPPPGAATISKFWKIALLPVLFAKSKAEA